ncbi:hypothetical protein PSN45_001959 [Yamadazyma tenuis]|uniref:SUN-domain-containing protein n=1 Tax=Candida tenuis (strain ATCC 10573 / BCRC 21748 / CBS 615 / JCM 9827 / NBRC 10315 / NRRL Y-1498 / VKM Y-70) TaxID=590646 RepID=G3BDA5_CANTC|nr:uncharacterized protein CANTEDRAFT_116338 [Yamadazyma tenuis ATCC 10573]XP_006690292.1 uncharacterized protein CANTEDRAFT_116338 [Yamadazyma tenuis ATCC 10573]EGV61077.1 hypothetical protein CANTEDRAFT_116338 [Yamadazyma tenuis ATCC 10573]EGV61078.1 hypothetical protein CANTEDRAFT_116338 [Yamadazyma tenuis ATCC 10573]WEJ94475.1 hypothetical protein PSN45_001959 [Yamadazyma tenuis]
MLFTQIATLSLAVLTAAVPVEKRSNTCKFPTDQGLIAVTPSKSNGGWAMSPDQECTAGSYCPYACPAGQLMAQWDPSATGYSYPSSMNGGIKCEADGTLTKPMSDNDYCQDGEGTLKAKNTADKEVAFCQTVLPGNEAMLIPTKVKASTENDLAVPGPNYYAGTAAHYYVNSPGYSTKEACVWGDSSEPKGNWAPYVAGANMDDSGNTFVKIGWNPKYVEDFNNKTPSFGIRITCEDESKCNGLKCEIDPSNFNQISGSGSNSLGASYCVVTVQDKANAKIEVFSA